MPAFKTPPGFRQWHERQKKIKKKLQARNVFSSTMTNGMSVQLNLPCAYVCVRLHAYEYPQSIARAVRLIGLT